MSASEHHELLTSDEVAARLGIKVETLYAYVSRGRLRRLRSPEGSRFDPLEVEALAAQRRRTTSTRRGSVSARPLMVLDTDLAMVEDDQLYFRGRLASELALTHSVERVAAWIWSGDWHSRLVPPIKTDLTQTAALIDHLPPGASRFDQLNSIAMGLGICDPWREETTPEALQSAGARFLLGVPALLPNPRGDAHDTPTALALWHALSPHPAAESHVAALNAALVLMIDHDLAISTLAGRIAASGRASGYSVITAALGACASPLHGSVSISAAGMLRAVMAGTCPESALSQAIATSTARLPGFGHFLYTTGDPRARTLMPLIPGLPKGQLVTEAVHALAQVVQQRSGLQPNIDLALAALTVASDMDDDAGSLIFGLGRSVGWIAHAMSEYSEKPLRLRPQGRYTGA